MTLGQGQGGQVGVGDVDGHGPGDVAWGLCVVMLVLVVSMIWL